MDANPPNDPSQPDYSAPQSGLSYPAQPASEPAYPPASPTAPTTSGSMDATGYPPLAAYPPMPGYPPAVAYPPSPTDYAQPAQPQYAPPPGAPAYPSVPLGAAGYPAPGYPTPGYGQPAYPSMPMGSPYMAPGYGQPAYSSMPMGSPYMAPGFPAPVQTGTSGQAIASIICASIGAALIVIGFLLALLTVMAGAYPTARLQFASFPLWTGLGGFLALTCSIPAVITGHLALGKIARSGGATSGRRVALTGVIMGYVEIATPLLCTVIFIVLAIAMARTGG